ncbi:MAG: hypothetical protein ACI31M_02215 [Bacilli bacterium]
MSSVKKMKTISIMWGMVIFALLVVIVSFSLVYKSKINKYEKLTSEMIDVTKDFVEDNNLYPVEGTDIRIKLSELQSKNLIGELKVKKDTCDGFVIVKNDGSYKYEGYLKCKLYITKGYKKA